MNAQFILKRENSVPLHYLVAITMVTEHSQNLIYDTKVQTRKRAYTFHVLQTDRKTLGLTHIWEG